MKNQNSLIGLFQGMFEGNILTFNPGWDENAKEIENFNFLWPADVQIMAKDIVRFHLENWRQMSTNTPDKCPLSCPTNVL